MYGESTAKKSWLQRTLNPLSIFATAKSTSKITYCVKALTSFPGKSHNQANDLTK